ncbi:MAG: hypothetical protein ABIU63_18650 [Chitinophagaceae bacterium]
MKKDRTSLTLPAFLVVTILLFAACVKDTCKRVYKIYTPVYTKLTDLRAQVQSKAAAAVTNTGKLYIRGNWIFLNEINKGIHVIDNSNPSHPVKVSFINIPGNIDMYVKGDILYADLYCDLLAADITDPKNIRVAKYLTNTFPDKSRYSTAVDPDSINIITDWKVKDTAVDCSTAPRINDCINCSIYLAAPANSSTAAVSAGMAGSMARFAAVDNYMYAVTSSVLNVIDISSASNPWLVKKQDIGWDIETIFPYNKKLYIGAGSSMSVYDLQDPVNPTQQSFSGHWCSGDPVVADDNYAYVTLHEANVCNSKVNQLEIYNLAIPGSPALVKTYPLTNPHGLSKDGNLLFICDSGLKIYDVSNVAAIKLVKYIPSENTYDVITANGIAYLVTKDGLYQYDYSDLQDIKLLSKLLK